MSRWDSKLRRWQRKYLILRDGNKCSICKKEGLDDKPRANDRIEREGERVRLEIEHRDGNFDNNDEENIRLTCHSCNMKERYRIGRLQEKQHGVRERERVRESKKEQSETSSLPIYPTPELVMKRSEKIKSGLLRYLFEVATVRVPPMNEEEILVNAPPWIDAQSPPADPTMRRWLHLYTRSEHYPYYFDKNGIIGIKTPEPIKKKEEEE